MATLSSEQFKQICERLTKIEKDIAQLRADVQQKQVKDYSDLNRKISILQQNQHNLKGFVVNFCKGEEERRKSALSCIKVDKNV